MARISSVTGHYVTVDVDGLEYKVFYLENGTGQPLVCQHTAGCHNHQWRDLLEDEEITANYRVIAYDLPRHGKSDPPENTAWCPACQGELRPVVHSKSASAGRDQERPL
ncbi:alpha/beta fold hydrolase [Kocuria palustris]|uniref:alpha/beta fold hydrolase n=1 Tax=Kocuria palustris TaxID=71999 RepID=UPI00204395C8|nr:hypothetical protein [Kocuria palustris]MCM3332843.1 hypothetical protein [Kocuria palustris]